MTLDSNLRAFLRLIVDTCTTDNQGTVCIENTFEMMPNAFRFSSRTNHNASTRSRSSIFIRIEIIEQQLDVIVFSGIFNFLRSSRGFSENHERSKFTSILSPSMRLLRLVQKTCMINHFARKFKSYKTLLSTEGNLSRDGQ